MRQVDGTQALVPGSFVVSARDAGKEHVVERFGDEGLNRESSTHCLPERGAADKFTRTPLRALATAACWVVDHMGAQIGVSHTTHERSSQNGRRPWWRRVRRGTHDGFCCDTARGLFLSRLEYGAFLVAGKVHPQSPVAFLAGSRLAHNRERDGLLEILRKAEQALADQGLTNSSCTSTGKSVFVHTVVPT